MKQIVLTLKGMILKASDTKGGYKPTRLNVLNTVRKENCFKLSGDGVFHTIQGEGIRSGYPITFIRLHFCNLKCTWCDTWYTWKQDQEEYYTEPFDVTMEELYGLIKEAQTQKKVKSFISRICFTGGEPLLQQVEIREFLTRYNFEHVEIETNGTIAPIQEIMQSSNIFFNCSPKLENSGNPEIQRKKPDVIKLLSSKDGTVFKFVCSSKEDIDEVLREYGTIIPREQMSIMPEGVTKEQNAKSYENMIGYILELGLTTHVRSQNIYFNGAKRAI